MKLRLARGLAFVMVIVLVAVVALQHVEDAVRANLARRAADSAAADTVPGRPR